MLAGIVAGLGSNSEQLDLEVRLGSLELERDVLGLHVGHPHVARRFAAVDHRHVLRAEAEQLEELDRRSASATATVTWSGLRSIVMPPLSTVGTGGAYECCCGWCGQC